MMAHDDAWPALPLAAWADSRDTLHMYMQVVGKVRLALTPLEPEWANVALYLTSRGFTTSPIPSGTRTFQIDFDCILHALEIRVSDGQSRAIPLIPSRTVADFYADVMQALRELGVEVRIWPVPSEIPDPIRFDEDRVHASYDPLYVRRFWTICERVASVFAEHRAPFRGRHTPVHFFWGSFDLAYTRFSGRPADPPPNADRITRVAMDSQEISAGFWPGDARFPEPAFYCYAYPKPAGIERAAIRPDAAFWSGQLGEFVLRYEDVRTASSPRAAILAFLESTYDAGAAFAGWDRTALDGTPAAR